MLRAPRFCNRRNPVVKREVISTDIYRRGLGDGRAHITSYVTVKEDGSDRY